MIQLKKLNLISLLSQLFEQSIVTEFRLNTV